LCLARSWERAWRRSGYHSDHGRLLADVVTSRATAAVREHLGAWRQQVGCRMISKVDVALLRPGQAPFLRGSMDTVRATAAAAVGVRWLLEVWARGLAVVDGAFVLEAGGVADAVRAVRWVPDDRGGVPAVAAARAVRDPEAGWRLTWDDV
ncbi:MAG: hypothetical protein ACRD0D_02720, partial [Acidimicrobiales bacterium]